MEERKGCIYMHKNKINGKVYIGQTINQDNPNRRWQNGKGYKSSNNNLFWNAIQKYGWDNFEHIILEKDIQESFLNEREIYWIAYYQADNQNFGYNSTSGGKNFIADEKFCQTQSKLKKKLYQEHPEIKEKISKSVRELWKNVEYRSNMLAKKPNISGENNPFYGHHHTEETKQKLRECFKDKKVYSQHCISVLNVETNQIFASCSDAAEALGKDRESGGKAIANAAKGISETSYGYHWKIIELSQEEKEYYASQVQKIQLPNYIKDTNPNKGSRGKIVKNLDTNVYYENCAIAAETLGYERKKGHNIACAASGRQKTALGYHWAYLENLPEYN